MLYCTDYLQTNHSGQIKSEQCPRLKMQRNSIGRTLRVRRLHLIVVVPLSVLIVAGPYLVCRH